MSLINWPELVERKIREAQAEGLFDDLPGKGEPLDLAQNPFVRSGCEQAHRLLQAAGFTLEWIEMDKEIRTEIDACHRFLEDQLLWVERTMDSPQGSLIADRELEEAYHWSASRYRERAGRLNERIGLLNLMVPLIILQRQKIMITEELRRFRDSWLRATGACSEGHRTGCS